MAKAVIAYDKDLPEVPDRRPWEEPKSFLVKNDSAPTGWSVDSSGRRPSDLILVEKLRQAVSSWRAAGYPGASDTTLQLFHYWFEDEKLAPGLGLLFHFYFGQREAIETLAYLVEVFGKLDAQDLVREFATQPVADALLDEPLRFQTTMKGERQLVRGRGAKGGQIVQQLPLEDLRRYAFKMATGSGKTWVMAMVVVWSYFHKRREADSPLSTNFLIVAPNVVVYQRLERDFESAQIFHNHDIPIIPPAWRSEFGLKVILRGDSTEPGPSANLFLVNVQQLYENRQGTSTPVNPVDVLLGRKPSKDLASYQRSVLDRVKSLKDLVAINDEAHHVHDTGLAWVQSLASAHEALPAGLSLWLDFSATPKDQGGRYFPWTVCDYPLAQAVEDRIVKAPIIVTKQDDPRAPTGDPKGVTKDNVTDKYAYWIYAAVNRWREHRKAFEAFEAKPVLFIMVERSVYADAVGRYLWQTPEFGLRESEVLVIHTDTSGEITKGDLEKARSAARDIDNPESGVKVIVSVLMLREGWDVRNVTVVLGLRPFTSKAEILPEQVVGRGLRLIRGIGAERTQTLEVLGTKPLLDGLRGQLEAEGVGVAVTSEGPPPPVTVAPDRNKIIFDISMPITKPRLTREYRRLDELDVQSLRPIFEADILDEELRIHLSMEFGTLGTEVHEEDVQFADLPLVQELIAGIASKIITRASLDKSSFARVVQITKEYVATRCFNQPIDLAAENTRQHLRRPDLQDGIASYLAREIGRLTLQRTEIAFEKAAHKLSSTKPFQWRRNLPLIAAKKTVFNLVATYNSFEKAFAEFLDAAPDVKRFAALGTTQQGESNTQFRVDYLKTNGAIGFYFPDWVVVQDTPVGEVNWIIETKGRVWEGTEAKDEAIDDWCQRVTDLAGGDWRYARVDQSDFDSRKPQTLTDAVRAKVPDSLRMFNDTF